MSCRSVGRRHPKVCRYWAGNLNGCPRDGSTCQYLHFGIGKEGNSKEKNGTLDMSYEDHNEDVDDSCDQCVWALNKKHDAVAHTKSLHGDTHYERENVMDSISSALVTMRFNI